MADFALRRSHPITALRLFCGLAARIGGSEAVSITALFDGGDLRTVASTDQRAVIFDRLQYGVGAGPCVQALSSDDVCVAEDLAADRQWPRWAEQAMARGLSSVLSVPLSTHPLGSLNLYSYRPRRYTDDDVTSLRQLALRSATVLGRYREQHARWRAVDVRTVVAQAEQAQCEQGFAPGGAPSSMLRSQRRDITGEYAEAETLVRRRRLPGLTSQDASSTGCWRG